MAKLASAALTLLALLLAASSVDAGYSKKRHHRRHHYYYHHKPHYYCQWKGSVCHDPVLVGADGSPFYFHGHKDADFCLVSDAHLHINAHFIGLRRPGAPRDFTWVQALGVLFGRHQLYVGAARGVPASASWDDSSTHRLSVALDGAPVTLPPHDEDAAVTYPGDDGATVTVTRLARANAIALEVRRDPAAGSTDSLLLRVLVRAVPVTEAENAQHGYGVTPRDCFAHLELNFQFPGGLSAGVAGVLGQTYSPHYRATEAAAGQSMPTLGGDAEFLASGLMAPDCTVSRFAGGAGAAAGGELILGNLAPIVCGSSSEAGAPGLGMVCRR